MAMVKQSIMLSGGVIASMAMTDGAFEKLLSYGGKSDAVYAPFEDLARATTVTMHAIFCYGWWDNQQNAEDGWWLCKNSWGPDWGLNGSFKIAYGAAYTMQPDYTFALEYSPQQPVRLLKVVDDLTMLTELAPELPLGFSHMLTDVVTSNVGRMRNLSAASKGPYRLCGKFLRQLLGKVKGAIVMQADPALCVTAPPEGSDVQVRLQRCGSRPSIDLQQFEYDEGQLRLQGDEWQKNRCCR
ncbi:hypothetical protein OEZ86_001526 [Tetradesmus obliquus]|nr:hypothetical protein OEZ86_001526 [Tetradesmus obliquus]